VTRSEVSRIIFVMGLVCGDPTGFLTNNDSSMYFQQLYRDDDDI
jgi:hypothetical protein